MSRVRTVRRDGVETVAKPSEEQAFEQRKFVYDLVVSGLPTGQIAMATAKRFSFSRKRAEHLIVEVHKEIRTERTQFSAVAKTAQLERLYNDLARMRATVPKPWVSIRMHENLIAELEATKAPVEIRQTFDVGDTMARVLAGITPERRALIVAEQRRLVERASLSEPVDTTSEAAE